MELPPALRQAVDQALEGVPLADLKRAADILSRRYRGEVRDGRLHLSDRLAAQAYLATRLPATYAAIRASLAAVAEVRPDFAPATLLDVGAGPGSALWAARDCWDSLEEATLVETSDAIRKVGSALGAGFAGSQCLGRRKYRDRPAAFAAGRPRHARLCAGRVAAGLDRPASRPAMGNDRRHARRRRAGNAGRLAAHTGGARSPYRCRRASRRALSASGGLPARSARLVPFCAPRRPLSPAPAGQKCRRAMGGREVHFRRRVEEAGRRAGGARRSLRRNRQAARCA